MDITTLHTEAETDLVTRCWDQLTSTRGFKETHVPSQFRDFGFNRPSIETSTWIENTRRSALHQKFTVQFLCHGLQPVLSEVLYDPGYLTNPNMLLTAGAGALFSQRFNERTGILSFIVDIVLFRVLSQPPCLLVIQSIVAEIQTWINSIWREYYTTTSFEFEPTIHPDYALFYESHMLTVCGEPDRVIGEQRRCGLLTPKSLWKSKALVPEGFSDTIREKPKDSLMVGFPQILESSSLTLPDLISDELSAHVASMQQALSSPNKYNELVSVNELVMVPFQFHTSPPLAPRCFVAWIGADWTVKQVELLLQILFQQNEHYYFTTSSDFVISQPKHANPRDGQSFLDLHVGLSSLSQRTMRLPIQAHAFPASTFTTVLYKTLPFINLPFSKIFEVTDDLTKKLARRSFCAKEILLVSLVQDFNTAEPVISETLDLKSDAGGQKFGKFNDPGGNFSMTLTLPDEADSADNEMTIKVYEDDKALCKVDLHVLLKNPQALQDKPSYFVWEPNTPLPPTSFSLEYYDSSTGLWTTEPQDVYRDLTSNALICPLHHFSTYRIVGTASVIDIPDNQRNQLFDRGYGENERNRQYTRGGRPYYVPVHFERTSLTTPPGPTLTKQEFDQRYSTWPVCFHGTTASALPEIIQNGLQIRPPRPGHIPPARTVFGIPNWGQAVFVSPSYKYPVFYGANVLFQNPGSTRWERVGPDWHGGPGVRLSCPAGSFQNGEIVFLLFMCRVNPNGFTVHPQTIGHGGAVIDPHYPNDQLEWRVANPAAHLKVYGLLKRNLSPADIIAGRLMDL